MIQRVRTLFFPTTFLTISALSVQAMEVQIDAGKEKVAHVRTRRCNGCQDPEKFFALYGKYPRGMQKSAEPTKQIVIPVEQKNVSEEEVSESSSLSHQESSSQEDTSDATEEDSVYFKNFNVHSREFKNIINKIRKVNSHIPPDFQSIVEYFRYIPKEKKQEAVDYLESKVGRNILSKYKCLPDGKIIDTPTKIKGTISLRDYLLGHNAQMEHVHKVENSGQNTQISEDADENVQTSEDLDSIDYLYKLEDAAQDEFLYQFGYLYPSEEPYHKKEPLQIEGM